MAAWEAVRIIQSLGLKPRRTIRAVIWTNEETGSAGGKQYFKELQNTGILENHSIALESDSGAFQPLGIGISCSLKENGGCAAAKAQLEVLGSLLEPIGSGTVTDGGEGADIEPICSTGIPCSGLNVLDPRLSTGDNNPCTANSMGAWDAPALRYGVSREATYDGGYFFFHHSEADTVERIDPLQLNRCAATLAVWAYAIAELPSLLPRDALPNSLGLQQKDRETHSLVSKIIVYLLIFVCCSAMGSVIVTILWKEFVGNTNTPSRLVPSHQAISDRESPGVEYRQVELSSVHKPCEDNEV